MYTSPEQLNAQVQSLSESNEQLLKSKARLQQDLLGVKKSLAEKEQVIQDVNRLIEQQAQQLAESKQVISELRAANHEQAAQLAELQDKTRQLEKERQDLLSRSWWQRLFG